MVDVTISKILILFGLLITTLGAALLPYICLQSSLKNRHKRKRENASDGKPKSIWQRVCCCNTADNSVVSDSGNTNGDQGTIAPSPLTKQRVWRSKAALSVLNCFAGGIFLATSFIGLIPEIRENFDQFQITWPQLTPQSNNNTINITGVEMEGEEPNLMPITEIVVTCGLFLILIIEQSAHSWNHWRQNHAARKDRGNDNNLTVKVPTASVDGDNNAESPSSSTAVNLQAEDTSQQRLVEHDHSSIRSLLLVATLSIHSLLEGIAIGLQDSIGSLLAIFVAVLFHKCLMALSMGTNLVRGKQSFKRILAAALIFAFMSPCGIAIGLIVKVRGGDSSATVLVNAILQAIATGTFLYITFFEVLVREFEGHGNRFAKVVAVLLGYAAVLGSFFAQHG